MAFSVPLLKKQAPGLSFRPTGTEEWSLPDILIHGCRVISAATGRLTHLSVYRQQLLEAVVRVRRSAGLAQNAEFQEAGSPALQGFWGRDRETLLYTREGFPKSLRTAL